MPIQKQSPSSTKTIIFDQREENRIVKTSAKGVQDIAKNIRNSEFNLLNCVSAFVDKDANLMYNIPSNDKYNYIMAEFDLGSARENPDIVYKKIKLFLNTKKYNVVADKVIKHYGDNPSCKFVIKI